MFCGSHFEFLIRTWSADARFKKSGTRKFSEEPRIIKSFSQSSEEAPSDFRISVPDLELADRAH